MLPGACSVKGNGTRVHALWKAALLISAVCAWGAVLQIGGARAREELGIRARPDRNSPVIAQVAKGAELRTLGGQTQGDFIRVAGLRGPAGWAPHAGVETLGDPKPLPCPLPGVAPKTKRSAAGQPTILEWNELMSMQREAELKVGVLQLDAAVKSELPDDGEVARIGGFIAAKPAGPRLAADCDGGSEGDWIFHITPFANTDQAQGVVARISVARRNDRWSLEKLLAVQARQFPVLVTGALFYDAAAAVNDDTVHPLPGQLRRAVLWELRAVSSVLVCTGGGECEPGAVKGWQALDELPSVIR